MVNPQFHTLIVLIRKYAHSGYVYSVRTLRRLPIYVHSTFMLRKLLFGCYSTLTMHIQCTATFVPNVCTSVFFVIIIVSFTAIGRIAETALYNNTLSTVKQWPNLFVWNCHFLVWKCCD